MLEHARLHQLCRHQCPSSFPGDEFKCIYSGLCLWRQLAVAFHERKKLSKSSSKNKNSAWSACFLVLKFPFIFQGLYFQLKTSIIKNNPFSIRWLIWKINIKLLYYLLQEFSYLLILFSPWFSLGNNEICMCIFVRKQVYWCYPLWKLMWMKLVKS